VAGDGGVREGPGRAPLCAEIIGSVTLESTLEENDGYSFIAMGLLGRVTTPQEYMFKAAPNRVTFTNVDNNRPVFCDGYAGRWTETAAAMEEATVLYFAAEAQAMEIVEYIENCNCSSTADQRLMLVTHRTAMVTHLDTIMRLNETAIETDRLFMPFMGDREMIDASIGDVTNSTQAIAGTLDLNAATGGSAESSAAHDTAIAVGVIVVALLIVLVVVFRNKLADMLGVAETNTADSSEGPMVVVDDSLYKDVAPHPDEHKAGPPRRAAPRMANSNYEA